MRKFTPSWCGRMFAMLACASALCGFAPQPTSTAPDLPVRFPVLDDLPGDAPISLGRLDPQVFFQDLIDRYRGLHFYKDTSRLVQITQRDGEQSSRVETNIVCEIAEGKLRVVTPTSQVREAASGYLPIKTTSHMRETQLRYDLWLAPHMAMKFTEQPLKNLRAGVEEGFTATEVESVTIDNKPMVHVQLKSGDGLSEDCAAKFDLFVNPESMLIERIDGEQRLPDGASYSTSLQITPEGANTVETAPQPPAPAVSEPAGLPAKPPTHIAPRT